MVIYHDYQEIAYFSYLVWLETTEEHHITTCNIFIATKAVNSHLVPVIKALSL